MIITLLSIAGVILGAVGIFICSKIYDKTGDVPATLITVVTSFIVFGIMLLLVLWSNYWGLNEVQTEKQIEYETLSAQIEIADKSDNEYARALLYDEVTKWNKEMQEYNEQRESIWRGWYFPDIYCYCKPLTFSLSHGTK